MTYLFFSSSNDGPSMSYNLPRVKIFTPPSYKDGSFCAYFGS
jgi:hypothetical protein